MQNLTITAVKYVASGGGIFLIKFTFLFFLYVTVRYLIMKRKKSSHLAPNESGHEKIFRASLLLIGALMSALFFLGIVVDAVNHSPAPVDVIRNSQALMEIDRDIFGVHPTIWLHQSGNPFKYDLDLASPYIINIYGELGMLISLLLLLALVFDPHLLFRVSVVFALSVFASVPFWVAFPALTPNETFLSNKLHAEVAPSLQHELASFAPNPLMSQIFTSIAENRDTGKDGYYGITTIPSMHITWSVFVLYYGILLYRKFAIYLVPYFILTVFSTIFLLQHFTLDIIAGIIVGVVLIFLVERTKGKTPEMVIVVGKSMRSDLDHCLSGLKRYFSRMLVVQK